MLGKVKLRTQLEVKATYSSTKLNMTDMYRHTHILRCIYMYMYSDYSSECKVSAHSSTPLLSPNRAVCQWIGRNSTLPPVATCLENRWVFNISWATSRKSSTKGGITRMRKKGKEGVLSCHTQTHTVDVPASTRFLNDSSANGPIPWTTNTRWSIIRSSPVNQNNEWFVYKSKDSCIPYLSVSSVHM